GLQGLPFNAHATLQVTAGVHLSGFTFGLQTNPQTNECELFLNPGHLDLDVTAALPSGEVKGELGFLAFSAMIPPMQPADHQTKFSGHFRSDLDLDKGLTNPRLEGGAHVELALNAGFAGAEGAAPSISANFVLDWTFNGQFGTNDHTFGQNLSVKFNDVTVSLGSFLSQYIGPVIEKVQEFTDPYKDFFHALADPLPVVSDLAKVVGDNDGVSLLDLAKIANGTNTIPEPYKTI